MKTRGMIAALALTACASTPEPGVALATPDYRARLERYLACLSMLSSFPPENIHCARAMREERLWAGGEFSAGVCWGWAAKDDPPAQLEAFLHGILAHRDPAIRAFCRPRDQAL